MLIAVNNFNLIKKSKPIIKNNETLFYLGKDADNRKYFLEKPGLRCGWYYSLNNISCYPQNMRGITFTTCLGNGENSLDKNKFLSESTCDLKRLLDIMNYSS